MLLGHAGPALTNHTPTPSPAYGDSVSDSVTLAGASPDAGGTLTVTNFAVGAPTTFNTVASGANAFTILNGHDIVVSGSAATLTLQGGTVNTLAIVPNTSGGFQLINLPRCS